MMTIFQRHATEAVTDTKDVHVKKFCDWEGSMHEFLAIGDLVDDEFVDHFIGVVPPAYMSKDIVQMGSPYDIVANRNTYPTLVRGKYGWSYAGNCHLGHSKEPSVEA